MLHLLLFEISAAKVQRFLHLNAKQNVASEFGPDEHIFRCNVGFRRVTPSYSLICIFLGVAFTI